MYYGIDMDTVTVSPKFQVVIHQSVRDRVGVKPGDRMVVLQKPVDENVALLAADMSMKYGLSMADAIISKQTPICARQKSLLATSI